MAQTVETPGGFSLESFRDGGSVPVERRPSIFRGMDEIARSYRDVSVPHWSDEHSPFTPDHGIVVASAGREVVGYSVYKRFDFADGVALYRSTDG